MASIRKRGTTWQAQVRRDGYSPLSKTFTSKADAQAWARDQERAIDRAEAPTSIRELKGLTVADLLRRYRDTVTPTKRGVGPEGYRLATLLAHEIAKVSLVKLSPAAAAKYRDDRLMVVQPGSVRRELAILQHCFALAKREWGIPLPCNPVFEIKLPDTAKARSRRLPNDDLTKLLKALNANTAWYLRPIITLAVETGMRRGELISIRWQDVDWGAHTVSILKTKNGHPRTIPLTPKALETLSGLPRTSDRILPVTPNAVRLAWERLRTRAGIDDLRLHDLRHEAVSRFFEYGLTVPEVALISGHRDPRMLSRYTHLRPEKVAEKLARVASL
jgi:integrase